MDPEVERRFERIEAVLDRVAQAWEEHERTHAAREREHAAVREQERAAREQERAAHEREHAAAREQVLAALDRQYAAREREHAAARERDLAHEQVHAALMQEFVLIKDVVNHTAISQDRTDELMRQNEESLGVLIRMMDEWIRNNPRNGAGAAPPPAA